MPGGQVEELGGLGRRDRADAAEHSWLGMWSGG
jgi:hypothetical protein